VLRVLTLNLWGSHGPLSRRIAGLRDYLSRHRPDVIGLQEVAERGGRTVAGVLAQDLGYVQHHDMRTEQLRPGGQGSGLAVLTDLAVHDATAIALPEAPRDQPRGLQCVDVDLHGTPLRIANTHLSWRLRQTGHRTAQARAIREALADWPHPIVVTGDFNDVPGSQPLRVLTGPDGIGLVDCYGAVHSDDEPTFSARNPYAPLARAPQLLGRRVDHVLARGFTPAQAAIVLTGADAPVVSDHYGVRVELERLAAA
jgi:endonuclease/exonuclease/phosphatase family metal-dependent hydrolase